MHDHARGVARKRTRSVARAAQGADRFAVVDFLVRFVPGWVKALPESVPKAEARLYRMRVAAITLGISAHAVMTLQFFVYRRPVLAALLACSVCFSFGMILLAKGGRHRLAITLAIAEGVAHVPAFTALIGSSSGYWSWLPGVTCLAFMLYPASELTWRRWLLGICLTATLATVAVVLLAPEPIFPLPPTLLAIMFTSNAVMGSLTLAAFTTHFALAAERAELRLNDELDRSDGLLLNILPASIADRLKQEAGTIAESFDSVTVLFADIVGFTAMSARLDSERIVAMLDELFSEFDRSALEHGLEKIKTIGDAYMAVGGLSGAQGHAGASARLALDMIAIVRRYAERTGHALDIRVGLHSGPAVAGVIGIHKFAYDIWGDTVNTASRMESHGEPGRIQLSEETRWLLTSGFELEERGLISVKGKGEVRTWYLLGSGPGSGAGAPEGSGGFESGAPL